MTRPQDTSTSLLTPEGLQAALVSLGVPRDAPIVVAVSGGADSLALMHVLSTRGNVTALTVDHGLRANSADEAAMVGKYAAQWGVPHATLKITEDLSGPNVQARARMARYRLMGAWCGENSVRHIVLGHHRDDQAETLIMRLLRGSGVDGLAAMAAVSDGMLAGEDVTFVRPLLPVAHVALVHYLQERDIPWVEDPSNQDAKYQRSRVRSALKTLTEDGLTSERALDTVHAMSRARDALNWATDKILAEALVASPAGFGRLDVRQLADVPVDIQLRALRAIIHLFGGGGYAPRLEALERLLVDVMCPDFKGATLSGVQFTPSDGEVTVVREWSAMPCTTIPKTGRCLYDRRWDVCVEGTGFNIAPLGEEAWARFKNELEGHIAGDVPYAAKLALPSLWRNDEFVGLAVSGYNPAGVMWESRFVGGRV